MLPRRLPDLFAVLAAMLAFVLLAGPARAHVSDEPSFAPSCHATSGTGVSFDEMASTLDGFTAGDPGAGPEGWNCSDTGWRADRPVAWVLFDAQAWAGEERPRYFFTRIARFETISFGALDADRTVRTIGFEESEAEPFAAGPVFQLALPEIRAETRALLVRVERPHSVPLLTEARLTYHPEDADWSKLDMALLALVVGMLILPLFFDITFFVVLRERFVALHAVMVVSMIGYVSFAGGLVSLVADLPVWLLAVAAPLFWAIGCGTSALFLAEFLKDDAQSPFMRRLTVATGLWTICVPGFFALQFHATQPFDDRAYFLTFIPAIVVITFAVMRAVWRGSRPARYIAAGWMPIIFASIERLLRGLGVYVGPSTLDQMLYLATGVEVIMISLAIAQRFLAIRLERDAAVTEARMPEQLSTRDPLTGLMNRRAVEERFRELRQQGFDTFALIDLDQFKEVNDRFGHQVGDRALIACAKAIRGNEDRDVIAVRLGGEEFVVLLRGEGTHARAEALRQSIPIRIAAEVEGLDRPVTASMGLIEIPRASSELMSFDQLYSRADQLLYHAKASGRNRTCFERLTVFKGAPPARRKTEMAA
jgi:diguanylate cyclase (GGDEF)-like protein